MNLGVATWPTGLPAEPRQRPAPATASGDPDTPDWWTGENTNEFLAEQGVVLQ